MKTHLAPVAERQLAVGDWLLSAAEERDVAREAWNGRGVALLSCGGLFSAVRIPADLVHAAARATDPLVIDAHLAGALLDGPVICDRYAGWYYTLVPAITALRWDVADVVCLGRGSSLGVPRPGVADADGERLYWSVPVNSAGALCSPPAVTQVIMTGRYLVVQSSDGRAAGAQ